MPLVPISRDDEVQGELLVEVMLDEFSEVRLLHFSSFDTDKLAGSPESLFLCLLVFYRRCTEV